MIIEDRTEDKSGTPITERKTSHGGHKGQREVTKVRGIVLVLVLVLVLEKTAPPLAGTGQLRKDRALFLARKANRSRTSTRTSTSTMPLTSEFGVKNLRDLPLTSVILV